MQKNVREKDLKLFVDMAKEAEPAKPEAPTAPEKKLYDSLEEEMASLLGRPPDKP